MTRASLVRLKRERSMKKRTLFKMMIGAALAIGLSGAAYADDVLAKVKAAGVMKVGTETEFAPFDYIDAGAHAGLNVDLFDEIGKELGVKIEWVALPWDGGLPGLEARRFEMVAGPATLATRHPLRRQATAAQLRGRAADLRHQALFRLHGPQGPGLREPDGHSGQGHTQDQGRRAHGQNPAEVVRHDLRYSRQRPDAQHLTLRLLTVRGRGFASRRHSRRGSPTRLSSSQARGSRTPRDAADWPRLRLHERVPCPAVRDVAPGSPLLRA